jgi:chorismate synthase
MYRIIFTFLLSGSGRVAAGAIAEKYLKLAHGIEVVAFVSSVGKVHLPTTDPLMDTNGHVDNDEAQDALSEDFRMLLATVTREDVDKHPTRCPNPETADRMTKVCVIMER